MLPAALGCKSRGPHAIPPARGSLISPPSGLTALGLTPSLRSVVSSAPFGFADVIWARSASKGVGLPLASGRKGQNSRTAEQLFGLTVGVADKRLSVGKVSQVVYWGLERERGGCLAIWGIFYKLGVFKRLGAYLAPS